MPGTGTPAQHKQFSLAVGPLAAAPREQRDGLQCLPSCSRRSQPRHRSQRLQQCTLRRHIPQAGPPRPSQQVHRWSPPAALQQPAAIAGRCGGRMRSRASPTKGRPEALWWRAPRTTVGLPLCHLSSQYWVRLEPVGLGAAGVPQAPWQVHGVPLPPLPAPRSLELPLRERLTPSKLQDPRSVPWAPLQKMG